MVKQAPKIRKAKQAVKPLFTSHASLRIFVLYFSLNSTTTMKFRALILLASFVVLQACNDNRNYIELPATSTNNEVVGVIEIAAGTNTLVTYSALTNDFSIDSANSPIPGFAAPANFGFVPGTNHNGERVAAVILGEGLPKGSIVEMHILGAIEVADTASKLILICASLKEEFRTVESTSLEELLAQYPRDAQYLEAWLQRMPKYKGKEMRWLHKNEATAEFESTVLKKSEDY